MEPPVIKVRVPKDAKLTDVTKAVNAKLTRKTTDLLRKNNEVVVSIFVFERTRGTAAKKKRGNPER
jgi:hypothetical protein